jgi:ABC-type transport system involved in cytochrome bd biosynthesis fused ATPase/permease subunit
MEVTTFYKIIIGIVLLAFWIYGSGTLTANPSLTIYIIPLSYGVLTAIAIVIQLVLRENIQAKMKKVLDSEIKERKEELLKELRTLVSYLERTKIPNYSESGVEGLEDDFKEFDSIKSKYIPQPKIIHATILTVLSSLVLFLFWVNPTLWVGKSNYGDLTLAHVGLGFLGIALWMILGILVTSLEVRIWEKEEKPRRQRTSES